LDLKRPKYLSPSAITAWNTDQEQFFLKYLAVDRPPRILQNAAMAVGSAFDAYVKSHLYERLFGQPRAAQDGFVFDVLFEKQVEPQNRDFAMKAGAICFQAYKVSGALTNLISLLATAAREPRFEFTTIGTPAATTAESGSSDGTLTGAFYNTVKLGAKAQEAVAKVSTLPYGSVVLLGKPDLEFVTKSGITVIDDWKVNGYMSKNGAKPVPGYMMLYDGFEPKSKHHGTSHKDVIPYEESDGLHYSLYANIEQSKPDWARQLAVYSWLCGAEVGSDIVIAIDQLCCVPSYPSPNISVALHRCVLTEKFQIETYVEAQQIWDIIHSDHIFRKLSLVDSIERCEILLKQASVYAGDDDKTEFLRRMRRNG